MARVAATTKITKPAVAPKRAAIVAPVSTGRKPGRLAAAVVPAKATAKVAKMAAAPKRATVASAPALKLSKDKLRVQVEKLERANATLWPKNREANRTAKAAAVRAVRIDKLSMGCHHDHDSPGGTKMPTLSVDGVTFDVAGWPDYSLHGDGPFVRAQVRVPAAVPTRALDKGSAHVVLDLEDGRVVEGHNMWLVGGLRSNGDIATVRFDGLSLAERTA